LTSGRPEGAGPLEHVAFRGSGIADLARHAAAQGVEIVRGPEPSGYGLSLYLADPDGNVVEIFAEETM
jgi:catechol-2,3-dioxygenase